LLGAASSFGAAALTLTLATTAFSEASGDGRMGPKIVSGQAFDETIHALNDFIQERYVQDDMLAALTAPKSQDFATTAVATASVPEMPREAENAFGVAVIDDSSLNDSVDFLNKQMASRGHDLFIQVAEEATRKGLDFADVAKAVDTNNALDRYLEQLAGAELEFGERVWNDRSLDGQVAGVNSHIQDFAEREIMLAQAVPDVTGSSFERFAIAMLISY
jgi:hypothetical protein